jgi:hypothetical protein
MGAGILNSCTRRQGRLERVDVRVDLVRLERPPDRVQRLEALAGDYRHHPLVGIDVPACGQLGQRRRGHAACGLREDAGRLGQQPDAGLDLVVGHGVDRPAAAARQLERVGPVSRVADRERLGDRVRLDRLADVPAGVERLGHRRAALGLCAVHRRRVPIEQAELAPLVEAAGDLGEQGAGRHRRHHAVGQLEAEPLGDLERERLRALGVVRAHVDVDERPLAIGGQLGAEPVDVVVVAAHRHELGAVDAGREDLLLLQVGRDEDIRLQPSGRRVGGHGVGQVARGSAGHRREPQLDGLGQRHRHDPILERVGRVGGVVLDPDLAQTERLGQTRSADERRAAGRQRVLRRALEREEVGVAPQVLRPRLDAPLDRLRVQRAVVEPDL